MATRGVARIIRGCQPLAASSFIGRGAGSRLNLDGKSSPLALRKIQPRVRDRSEVIIERPLGRTRQCSRWKSGSRCGRVFAKAFGSSVTVWPWPGSIRTGPLDFGQPVLQGACRIGLAVAQVWTSCTILPANNRRGCSTRVFSSAKQHSRARRAYRPIRVAGIRRGRRGCRQLLCSTLANCGDPRHRGPVSFLLVGPR